MNNLERQSRNQRLLEMSRKKAHGEHGKNPFRVLCAKFRGKNLCFFEKNLTGSNTNSTRGIREIGVIRGNGNRFSKLRVSVAGNKTQNL
jgi:hypothetical protein